MFGRLIRLGAAIIITAAVTVYAVMVFVTIPHLTEIALANGMAEARPFDLMPSGYDFTIAQRFLSALGPAGRDEYLNVQHRLDTVFPLLFGLSLAIGLFWAGMKLRLPRILVLLVTAALASAATVLDWAENSAVAVLLRSDPEALDPAFVQKASDFTVWKTIAVSVAMTALLLGLIAVAFQRFRSSPVR